MINIVTALYPEDGPVRLLSGKEEFNQKVLQAKEVCIVELYTKSCPHCKALAPVVEKLAIRLEGIIPVYAVDCEAEENLPLCREVRVQGFPTIKIYPADQQNNPYTKQLYKDAIEYTGPRSAKAIADAAYELLPDTNILRLKSPADLQSFATDSPLPRVLLISNKAALSPLYKSLALRFKGRLAVAEAQESAEGIPEMLGLDTFPALIILSQAGEQKAVFEGKMKAKELIAFLEEHAGPVGSPDSGAQTIPDLAEQPKTKNPAFIPDELKLVDLQGKLTEDESAWLVAAFGGSNESCPSAVEAWADVIDKLGGLTNAGTLFLEKVDMARPFNLNLDADRLREQPCEPQILLLPFGEKEDLDWILFTGALHAKELQQFALATFPSRALRLTAATMPQLLGIQPSRPKVVLFTEKTATPPVFAALSANFVPKGLDFFDVHASEAALLQQFGVKKVPALVLTYLPPATAWQEGDEHRMALQQYQGPLKYPYMAAFLESIIQIMAEESRDRTPRTAVIEEVSDNQSFLEKCSGKLGLCIIALLDKKATPDEHLAVVQAVAAARANHPLHYIWVDAARQSGLLSTFKISHISAPLVVAYSGSKRRFAVFTDRLKEASLAKFLDELLAGKARTEQLQEPPKLIDGGQEPGPPEQDIPPMEEEFDLADIMAEEIAESGVSRSKSEILAEIETRLQEENGQRDKAAKPSTAKGKKRRRKKSASAKLEL